jgi:hypothetical protein
MTKWQPIETAPRETKVIVLRRDGEIHIARVSNGSAGYYGIMSADFGDASCLFFFPVNGDEKSGDYPTHWMPLPEPVK